MHNKTFRLFISSTFNDFHKEREVLQTKVFPKIKEYASKVGYTFQPIDLRWGVSNEAQLDQKTLELCLDEVRACKTNPHPNFLIMLGDRYGWVPLPYAIEKQEFETILTLSYSDEIEYLLEWYRLDLNQLPASYILKERGREFEDYDKWTITEDRLRNILQASVNKSALTQNKIKKYFLSATEAEVEEGVLPYGDITDFQREVLLTNNNGLVNTDPKHIFGFFRNIDKSTKRENRFIDSDDDYDKAQVFQQKVKKELDTNNTLHINTEQIDRERLKESYLEEFETHLKKFLKSQIDSQKEKEIDENLSALEIELEAQSHFAEEKRKDFIAQENILKDIDAYIQNESKEALIIYGKSGIGKSSVIAQAIKNTKDNSSKRIIYRFIGATPFSSSSLEILVSIFEELEIDIRSEDETQINLDATLKSIDDTEETFEQFSYRVYDEIQNIKEDVIVFIDAVDQLVNQDQFLWLPNNLPKNVKIIISALNDEKYSVDSVYFQVLKEKINISNLIEIGKFSKPKQLICNLLRNENRTLQQGHEDYFMQQIQTDNSPLYVKLAAEVLKHWKSYDSINEDLVDTQQGIIEKFINNLSRKYHHNKEFVSKVIGYIVASKDGLSESELLQLISTDKEFIEEVAPQEFHKNHNLELPLVHWSRLYAQLKPFLGLKTQDGNELMYFSHREFIDVIAEFPNQRLEHQSIMTATQKLILNNLDRSFYDNRWGRLYIRLVTEYELCYEDEMVLNETAEFITNVENDNWLNEYINFFQVEALGLIKENTVHTFTTYQEIIFSTLFNLYKKNPTLWADEYAKSSSNLSHGYLNLTNIDMAILCAEEALNIRLSLYESNSEKWKESLLRSLNGLAVPYIMLNRIEEASKLLETAFDIVHKAYSIDKIKYTLSYLMTLGNSAQISKLLHKYNDSIKIETHMLSIVKELYESYPVEWRKQYVLILQNLGVSYAEINHLSKSIEILNEALNISEKFYMLKPNEWIERYRDVLHNLAYAYAANGSIIQSQKLLDKCIKVTKTLYDGNPNRWAFYYVENLNSFAFFLGEKIETKKEAIIYYKESLEISTVEHKKDSNKWKDVYTAVSENLKYLMNKTYESI